MVLATFGTMAYYLSKCIIQLYTWSLSLSLSLSAVLPLVVLFFFTHAHARTLPANSSRELINPTE